MATVVSINRFPQIAAALHVEITHAVSDTADSMAADMQNMAPVDTGFLRDSIYVSTPEHSTYGQAGAPPEDSYLLPDVGAPPDDTSALVAVGANYAVFLEYGTRFQPAQPYFYPGVENARGAFDARLSQIDASLQGTFG